jgi:hypothetical protein
MKMRDNWSARFKDAAGGTVFTAGGYVSPVTMDIKTAETFLNKALVALEEAELKSFDKPDGALRDAWVKAVVEAPDFGIAATDFDRKDVSNATLQWAKDTAENNRSSFPVRIL